MPSIEVVFSPALYSYKQTREHFVAVVIDVLRATTSMVAAFGNGVARIIPVPDLEQTKRYKEEGYLVAAERDGKYLDFADFGNSPFDYRNESVKDKTIAYSTTNGTQAICLGQDADFTIIAAFNNASAVATWLIRQNKDVVILCAGWKNMFNLEDSVCAGFIIDKLLKSGTFQVTDDAAIASYDLFLTAAPDLLSYIDKASHRERLRMLGVDDSLNYCLTPDSEKVVPGIVDGSLVDVGHITLPLK